MNAHHKKRSYRPLPPKSTARFTSGSDGPLTPAEAEADTRKSKLRKTAERVPFGWQLDALIPAVGSSSSSLAATELANLVRHAGGFYRCTSVTLADLLEPEFMNSYIRKGSLVALSLDDDEGADVVAIDGRGRLVLSVPKETYEVLGLPGRASAYGSLRQRFIIEVSLIDPAFRSGKPGFERVKRLLRDWPRETSLFDALAGVGLTRDRKGKTFDMVMCYADEHGVSQPIQFPSTVPFQTCQTTLTRRTLTSIRVPAPSSFPPSSTSSQKKQRTSSGAFRKPIDERALFWDEYREWAGLAMLGDEEKIRWRKGTGDAEEEEEEEWGTPLGDCEKGEVTVLSWTGLLHPQILGAALERVSKESLFTSSAFLSFNLRPFPHSPIYHLSTANPPVVGTSKKPNGKKRKRGRGRGEEEEADRARMEEAGGWEVVMKPAGGGKMDWYIWEGQ
ncbi:hypothetical protein JCM11641_004518 [Rhodosporidiobolus odoratus]